jgi:hypothetical protein
MDHAHLRASLERLRSELQGIEPADDRERAKLLHLEQSIQELLVSPDDALEPHGGLSGRMQKAMEEIETRHPQVTLLMGQVADALAKLGI